MKSFPVNKDLDMIKGAESFLFPFNLILTDFHLASPADQRREIIIIITRAPIKSCTHDKVATTQDLF